MKISKFFSGVLTLVVAVAALAVTVCMLAGMVLSGGSSGSAAQTKSAGAGIMDKYDMYMTNQISEALDGIISVDKVYWLSDEDLVAPEPNPDGYGTTDDPSSLQWLLDGAAELLDGQETLFTTDTVIRDGSTVHYYYDETILVLTWKEVIDNSVYTFSEVKIAHPSQFRRFLAGGEYGSEVLYTTTEMAASVNAVTASSGDYYSYRHFGVVVNNGQVYRSKGTLIDTCFIDENGDMIFSYVKEIEDQATAEQFVEENNVRFSLSFGPILVQDGVPCELYFYNVGQVEDHYARAALGQLDKLHYVLVTVNMEDSYTNVPTINMLANRLSEMGIPTAYALDGGQTAAIVTGDQLINSVNYGYQREISDIVYFATAIPSDE